MNKEFSTFIESIKNIELWYNLAEAKLRVRFLRTKLGPLWEIVGTLIIIAFISLIWAKLWGKEFKSFLPYLFFGYVLWKTIVTMVNDANMLYHEIYKTTLENVYIHPFTLSIVIVSKHFIIFFGFILCCFIISFFTNTFNFSSIFLLIYFLFVFFLSSISLCFLLGMLCLRYRDLQHSISVILNLAFFVTPIIWEASQLGEKGKFFINMNIIYHYIEFYRSLMIYGQVNISSFMVVSIFSFILFILALYISKKFSRKVVFWLM